MYWSYSTKYALYFAIVSLLGVRSFEFFLWKQVQFGHNIMVQFSGFAVQ